MAQGPELRWGLADTLVVVSIVASGVMVAGLLHTPSPDEAAGPAYLTPEVEFPTTIPGCDTVAAPSSDEGFAAWLSGDATYDNPRYPWFTAPKATAMSDALRASLPAQVQLEFADPDNSLTFQPMHDYSGNAEFPDDMTVDDIGGDTTASGLLVRGDERGRVSVTVRQRTKPVPECVAGALDRRSTFPDGTVVDTLDTWAEYDGVRTLSRQATAYLPDHTQVQAWASDEYPAEQGNRNSGGVPLTVGELSDLARTPGLATTAPVPEGTPPPPRSCDSGGGAGGFPLTRATVAEVDTVLDGAWQALAPDGVTLDRPLGSLQPAGTSPTGLCTTVDVRGPAGTGRLSVVISDGQALPAPRDPYDPATADDRSEYTTLADGSVVQRTAPDTVATMRPDGATGWQTSAAAVVTRPDGFRIQVRLSSDGDLASDTPRSLDPVLTLDQLQSLASTPGLRW
ncbi:hypothetical protein [Rhodococcus sp. Q]|uniref:hypothetical protein n=1 Tax=Rhodococcus sp. Q TaxID=2502252 RepID=UPI0010F80CCF|nr:hypothetical protein [Rhodococcus sp. Q]